ncbi:MAG: hypothetical protein GQ572_03230 [Gammaproteobacteria bacterium]|nr:hypothetical protein [Gammaproteobacteria bacterium]
MKRLFYFTGYRLSVLHWKGRALVGSTSFEPTATGLNNFRHYLLQTGSIPGKFLVDVIEEDFRNERIPHVGSKDRAAVISRLIDRYYRSSQDYCYHELIGREKEGRRDDIVLLGAMTNPKLIQSWLTIIDECEVPLSGIWTLPIISKKILKTLNATSGVVLLISQQVNSNVRQTLFRDGKLLSSRQSIINQDSSDISSIGKLAAPEVTRTIEFVRAQNLVSVDEVINLHIIGSSEQLQSLQESFKSTDKEPVVIHPVTEIHRALGLTGVAERFSDSIFSWLCIDQAISTTHYGSSETFVRYRNKLVATALYAASLLVVITSVLLTQSNVSDAMEYEKSISLLKKEEKSYKALYSKKFKDFEEVFENAGVMNAAVDLAEQIKVNGATSPLDFMISLSEILSQDAAHTLHIDKVRWQAVNIEDKSKKINQANFTSADSVKHDVIVTGRIDDSENNYRASIEHIQRIIQYLEGSNRVENVETLTMPVDLRSESKFSTESGVDTAGDRNEGVTGVFSFKIIMKEPDHV